jgi:hypothetical protein
MNDVLFLGHGGLEGGWAHISGIGEDATNILSIFRWSIENPC